MGDSFPNMLVVANSARMLAHAARLAGFNPIVIDMFGDRDTLLYAEAFQKISSLATLDLDKAIVKLTRRYPVECVVYGSGFERFPESLVLLGNRFTLLGNQPEVFRRLHEKPVFFALLDALGISYPQVSFQPPDSKEAWLVKPMQGQGGIGIRNYQGLEESGTDVYWQRFQEGEPHSVLFLADGKQSQIIGFNKQWTAKFDGKEGFVFSGIINYTGLAEGQKAKVANWLDSLVASFSLKGLNSLDFIQCGEDAYVLEINPRPPASMQLYGEDLFIRHLKACRGWLDEYELGQPAATGYQVVYAMHDMVIPADFQWPSGTHDLPHTNTRISAGQPICSMIMRDQDPNKVLELLQEQQEFIINALDRFQTHGI